jgi:hypothetical protein
MWKDSIRNIVIIFQTTILRFVGFYVRRSANILKENYWILRIGLMGKCQKVPKFDFQSQYVTVKSRAVDQSTIQFLTILGVLLTKTCYHPRHATIAMSSNQFKSHLIFLPECRILKNSDQIFFNLYLWKMHLHDKKMKYFTLLFFKNRASHGKREYIHVITKIEMNSCSLYA